MPGLTISDFYLSNGSRLHAAVTWDASNPGASAGAEMTGVDPVSGQSWEVINGGIAFLNVIRGDGASLRIETWGTDTNSNGPADIDIFTLPIDLTQPFPPAFANLPIVSPHQIWTYVLTPIPGNPFGFNLDAGQ